MRNDIHSPKNIIPSDYEFVVVRTRNEFGTMDTSGIEVFNAHRNITGGVFSDHDHGGDCHVCGASMIDYAIFYHAPTNSYIRTGCDCAEKIEFGHKDDFKRVAELRRAAKRRAAKVEKASTHLDQLGILDFVETMFDDDEFNVSGCFNTNTNEALRYCFGDKIVESHSANELSSFLNQYRTLVEMVRNLVSYGWSEKQDNFACSLTDTLVNMSKRLFEREEERKLAEDAPEGKITVVGTVLTVKQQEGFYGVETKMLVQAKSGYKVWCSVPKAILGEVEKNSEVQFNVNLTPSSDDPKFAIGKRPSKARVL